MNAKSGDLIPNLSATQMIKTNLDTKMVRANIADILA